MKYVVSVSYHDFEFNDSLEAVAFAERAKNHYKPSRSDESPIRVEIAFVNEEDKKED